jgi:hypothetical protein
VRTHTIAAAGLYSKISAKYSRSSAPAVGLIIVDLTYPSQLGNYKIADTQPFGYRSKSE